MKVDKTMTWEEFYAFVQKLNKLAETTDENTFIVKFELKTCQ